MKHTPGPWLVHNNLDSGNGLTVRSPEEGALVSFGQRTNEQAVADAHLISAAPELLRECGFALDMLNAEERSSVRTSLGYRNFVHRLEQVIAKAKGEDADYHAVMNAVADEQELGNNADPIQPEDCDTEIDE